jgi:hypothetical protein
VPQTFSVPPPFQFKEFTVPVNVPGAQTVFPLPMLTTLPETTSSQILQPRPLFNVYEASNLNETLDSLAEGKQ